MIDDVKIYNTALPTCAVKEESVLTLEVKRIKSSDNNGVVIYPNPARSSDKVTINGAEASFYSLTDGAGRELVSGYLYQNSFDFNDLGSGIYFVILFNENKERIGTRKLIIK